MSRALIQDGKDNRRIVSLYSYIKGKVEYKYEDRIVVENAGIGYNIIMPMSSLEAAGPVGNEVKVYTHLYVREDQLSIYGFMTQEELSMFELLTTVSGVGPKVAISLISNISPSKFGLSVITDDIKALTKAPGIGNKTAQRIILELKDKIKKEQLTPEDMESVETSDIDNSSRASEAINALMVLGYSAQEASKAVASVYSEDLDVEIIIKNSLKNML